MRRGQAAIEVYTGLSCQWCQDGASEYSRKGAVQFTVSVKDLVAGADIQENRMGELVSVGWLYGQ